MEIKRLRLRATENNFGIEDNFQDDILVKTATFNCICNHQNMESAPSNMKLPEYQLVVRA